MISKISILIHLVVLLNFLHLILLFLILIINSLFYYLDILCFNLFFFLNDLLMVNIIYNSLIHILHQFSNFKLEFIIKVSYKYRFNSLLMSIVLFKDNYLFYYYFSQLNIQLHMQYFNQNSIFNLNNFLKLYFIPYINYYHFMLRKSYHVLLMLYYSFNSLLYSYYLNFIKEYQYVLDQLVG